MARVRVSKGTITLQRAVREDSTPLILVTGGHRAKLCLSSKHHLAIELADKDLRFDSLDLGKEAHAAAELLVSEIDKKINATAHEKAKAVADEAGLKIEE